MVDLHLVKHDALAAHHIVVVVCGEVGVQAVGGFGAFAVADVVGQDQEIFRDVEGLAGTEKDAGEDGIEQRMGVTAGAVEQEDGVVDVAGGVAVGGAEGQVVELEFGQDFAGAEAEVGQGDEAVGGGPGYGVGWRGGWRCGGHGHGLALGG